MPRRPPELRFFQRFLRYWLPVLVYITVIIAVSAQANLQPPVHFENSDKFFHVFEYMLLGILLARAVWGSRVGRPLAIALIAVSLGIVVGTSDEYFQSFIPG